MFDKLLNGLVGKAKCSLSIADKDKIAELLKTTPEFLEEFEKSYSAKNIGRDTTDIFYNNAKDMVANNNVIEATDEETNAEQKLEIIRRIIDELVEQTPVMKYDGNSLSITNSNIKEDRCCVNSSDLRIFSLDERPQLTGNLLKKDTNGVSYPMLLDNYIRYLQETDVKKKKTLYGMFRQGLDILDLDDIIYQILGMNKNSMGYWFPSIVKGVQSQTDKFFKIPKTTIIKVPLTMLQLTRLDYESLNKTTLNIVDRFCDRVFELKPDGNYFVKTGTYSSKFDFRNAHVYGNEVKDLGEYLLFIQNQACLMAGPLTQPSCIYGVSTTNEWVVREFIEDIENNPTIYEGLSLHTEYRVFVDFDTKEVLGIHSYWDSDVMKKRLGTEKDKDENHNIHDYIIYSAHEEKLYDRYNKYKDLVVEEVKSLLENIDDIGGQWSIDIMQNGMDFWIIDMALAYNSMFKEVIPKEKLKIEEENWIPNLEIMTEKS